MDGTEKLRGQMRDTAEGGQQEETEVDRAQDKARAITQRAVYRLGEKALGKKKVRSGTVESGLGTPAPPPDSTIPDIPATPDTPQDSTPPLRIKTRGAIHSSAPLEHNSQRNTPQIKTRDVRHSHQVNGQGSVTQNPPHQNAASAERPISQPIEQGRQKFVREQQKKATSRKAERPLGPDGVSPARRQDNGSVRPRSTSMPFNTKGQQPIGNPVRGTVPSGKRRIKSVRSEAKAVGRASRQAIKATDSPKQTIQAGARSAKTAQQTVRAAAQAQQQAVQAAGAAKRTAVTVGKPVAKAAVSALRGAVSAIRSLMAPLAAGGGAVIAVVLVLCLIGGILASPLGIFFSGEDSGTGQTISSAVREISQEYNDRVEALKTEATYDTLSISGSRATWPEI
ncbi:MAG: hypothetical protein NC489_42780, partial [Ruminococcus flavefaciens]|nr:hypothetical protein [Ruminococcus flavefaciens]